jgi:membrane protein required for colicin V production
MTEFDYAVLGILVLSALFAAWRGLVREVLALAGWVAAFLAAVLYSGNVATMLSPSLGGSGLRYLAAFALVFVGTLIVFALIAWALSKFLRAIGLGFLDRFLGAVFGLARGLLIVVALVLFAGLTTLPKRDWWREAMLARPLETAVLAFKPWLPLGFARQLHYPGDARDHPSLAR